MLLQLCVERISVTNFSTFQLKELVISPFLVLIKILFCFIIFREGRLYRSWRGKPYSDQFSRLFLSFILSSSMVTAVWLILDINHLILPFPFFLWLFVSLFLILLVRASVYTAVRQLRKKGVNQKKIFVFGAGNLGKSLIEQIRKSPESGYQVISVLITTNLFGEKKLIPKNFRRNARIIIGS